MCLLWPLIPYIIGIEPDAFNFCRAPPNLPPADQDAPPLDIPWPYVGVLLMQLTEDPEDRRELLTGLRVNSEKAFCPAASAFINTYLGALWSVSLLNDALGHPHGQLDFVNAYDGPFLHTMLRSLHSHTADSKDHKYLSMESDTVVLRLEESPLLSSLLSLFSEGVVEEVGKKALSGKVSARKLKFTMPAGAGVKHGKPEKKTASKPSNPFEALRS